VAGAVPDLLRQRLHNNVCIVFRNGAWSSPEPTRQKKMVSVGTPANVDDVWSEFFSRLQKR